MEQEGAMTMQDADIVQQFHRRDGIIKDALGCCAKRHSLHAEQEARDRLEAMLHRCSDEMTARARAERMRASSSTEG